MERLILRGARIFDGSRFHDEAAVVISGGRVAALISEVDAPEGRQIALGGGTLAPGLVDLRAQAGDTEFPGNTPLAAIARICATHARLGTTSLLPTLVSDNHAAIRAALAAGTAAVERVPGFLGLHLDPRDARQLIRPLEEDDIDILCEARAGLPALMLTLGPKIASTDQIARLEEAGLVIAHGLAELGTDLALPETIRLRIETRGCEPEVALAMATSRPAATIGRDAGRIAPGLPADLVHFTGNWRLTRVWQGGTELQAKS